MRCYVVDGRLRIENPSAECVMIFGQQGRTITVDPIPVRIRMVPGFPPPWPQHARRALALCRERTGELCLYGDDGEAETISHELGYHGLTAVHPKTFAQYLALKRHPRLKVMYPSRFTVTAEAIHVAALRFPRYLATLYYDDAGVERPADYTLPHYQRHVRVRLQPNGLHTFYNDQLIGPWTGFGAPADKDAESAMRLLTPGERAVWGSNILIVLAEPERAYYYWLPIAHWGLLPNAAQPAYFALRGQQALVRTIRGIRVARVDGTYLQSTRDAQVTRAIVEGKVEELAVSIHILRDLNSGNPEVELVECLFNRSSSFILVKELANSSICARTKRHSALFFYEGLPYRLTQSDCVQLSHEWVMRRVSPKVIGTVDYCYSGVAGERLAQVLRACDGYLEDFVLQQTDASVALLRRLNVEPMTEAEASFVSLVRSHEQRPRFTRSTSNIKNTWKPPPADNQLAVPNVSSHLLKVSCVREGKRITLRLPSSLELAGVPPRWSADALHPSPNGESELVQRILTAPPRFCIAGMRDVVDDLVRAVSMMQRKDDISVFVHCPHSDRSDDLFRKLSDAGCSFRTGRVSGELYGLVICYEPRHSRGASYIYNCHRLIVVTSTGLLMPTELLKDLERHQFPHCEHLPKKKTSFAFELLALMALEGALIETGYVARDPPVRLHVHEIRPITCDAPEAGSRAGITQLLDAEYEQKTAATARPTLNSMHLPKSIPYAEYELSSPLFSIVSYFQLLFIAPNTRDVHVRLQTNLDVHAACVCKQDAEHLNIVYGISGTWEHAFEYPALISNAIRTLMAKLCE